MAKKSISCIADKLSKVNESFTVYMYDNGYMFEISGRDSDNEYKTAKIMVQTADQIAALVQEAAAMPKDD
jgi:hypothetical protein